MTVFAKEYKKLNKAQARAVDTIDGPLLVIAGPGTGKTQLLSARVAHILESTDTAAQNILCLTFTENGAENMRQRMARFIGQDAYDVQIGTYHSFGSDLIRRFPQYFLETRLQTPIDELSKHEILRSIVEKMNYDNPLKQTRHHLGDLIGTISEVKKALLSAEDLRAIATENAEFIDEANQAVMSLFEDFKRMPSVKTALPLFESLFTALKQIIPTNSVNKRYGSLAQTAAEQLLEAIETAQVTNKTTSLTTWKNKWLVKDVANRFTFNGKLENSRIAALEKVLLQYQNTLADRGLYDFDDMIIRAINALEKFDDFRFTLQEQYLYLLLDEFQDTNAAQLKLVELLTNNPVHEGRPNVMAVGDDDQAIYAFQGARYSNMLDFYKMYRDVEVVNLTDNYRSHADILSTAYNIAEQIDSRLQHHFASVSKTLIAANKGITSAQIVRTEFLSDVAQYDWVSRQITTLIKQGVNASQIAVLAPKHKQLEPLVPHLNESGIPVKYEKRENILKAPVVQQLITMAKLVLALHANNTQQANALWPEVLSYDFWELPTSHIWQLSWQLDALRDEANWSSLLLEDKHCRPIALLILALANRVDLESCEAMLDFLIGSQPVSTHEIDIPVVSSKLRSYFTGPERQNSHATQFYETMSHLTVLRTKLRDFQQSRQTDLSLQDLIDLVDLYEAADERMMNTSPYSQSTEAVQLMTVFKAKGLEFEYVFLVCCQDDVWGGSSRGNSNKLTLPANLEPIRHAGATDDERLRILFVAITRARRGLFMTSYLQAYNGKATKRLKYLNEQQSEDGSYRCLVLPQAEQAVLNSDYHAPDLRTLQLSWHHRHVQGIDQVLLRNLLEERLKQYRLSPTHLNSFTDLTYGGPDKFFLNTILRFPQAPSVNSMYGNAIHETLEWLQHQVDETGSLPSGYVDYFEKMLRKKSLTSEQLRLELDRGQKALRNYIANRGNLFVPGNKAEHNFKHEGVVIGDVLMSGKIDLLEIDAVNKTITVVDYKTGKSYSKWESDSRLHKYKQQLYCYKLLLENSHSFKDYEVIGGRLEFIEPDSHGNINALTLTFSEAEVARITALIQVVWGKVMNLDFPDVSGYEKSLSGSKAFEADLLEQD